MAENNNLLREKAQIIEQIRRIQAEQGKDAAKLDESYIKLKGRLEDIVKVLKGFVTEQNKTIQGAVDLESGAKSLGTIYNSISGKMKEQAVIQRDIAAGIKTELENGKVLTTTKGDQQKIVNSLLSKYNEQSSLAAELAQLTADDVVAKQQLEDKISSIGDKIKEEVSDLDKRTNIAKQFLSRQDSIAASVEEQLESARDLSSLSQEQKDILEQQAAVFDSMKKKVDALGSTLTTFLSRPQAAIGALVIGVGKFAGKFGEVNRELGQTFAQGLNESTLSATGLGFIFDDTAGTVRELAHEMGGVDAATLGTQANIGLMAMNMGISNKEAVGLTASFARMNGGSTEIAADMMATTREFAHQNGVIPAALMQDLAGSAEAFALFGKDGGENILRAAGYAQKLGVSMNTLSGISEGLLDFESSITKELELGAMLGKNINLDRARALAFEGKIEEATAETLKQLGGIEAFNKMDPIAKKQTADLLGVSVAELQKMNSNQEKAGTLGAVMNEKFSKAGEILNGGLNKYLGTGLEGLGGMITMTGKLGTGFSALGVNMGDIVKKSASFVKNMVKAGAQKVGKLMGIGGKVTQSIGGKATSNLGGAAKGAGGGMKSMGKGMGAGLKGLAKGVSAFASPQALLGLAAVTAAIIGIGFALKIAAPGIKAFGEAIGNIVKSVGTAVATIFGGLGDFFGKIAAVATPELALSIIGIAGGFGALTASLAAFSIVGLAAVPAMAAISAFGAVSGLLGMGAEGGEGGGDSALLEEIKGLRADLNDGKVGVYMDGQKVTAAISKVVNKIGSNSYAIV